ncbi:DUF5317 family protein [Actinomadura harenae]|nr:DUF5317 family protein [Actinomadura harenae]
MFLLVVGLPVLVGLAAGYASGGRISRISGLRLRALWLPWVAALVQLAQYRVAALRHLLQDRLHVPMLALVFGLMCLWVAVNMTRQTRAVRTAGVLLLGGAALNGTAIALNGRMPYSRTAAVLAGQHPGHLASGPKNMPAEASTHLAWLGDVIPLPPLHAVASIGDVFLLVGVVTVLVAGMHLRPTPRPASRPDPTPA